MLQQFLVVIKPESWAITLPLNTQFLVGSEQRMVIVSHCSLTCPSKPDQSTGWMGFGSGWIRILPEPGATPANTGAQVSTNKCTPVTHVRSIANKALSIRLFFLQFSSRSSDPVMCGWCVPRPWSVVTMQKLGPAYNCKQSSQTSRLTLMCG